MRINSKAKETVPNPGWERNLGEKWIVVHIYMAQSLYTPPEMIITL